METERSKKWENTYYVIGESRTNMDNAITKQYGSFYIALEVDGATNMVLGFSCTHTLELTEQYLKRWFIGEELFSISEWLEGRLDRFYGGSSRRAIMTAYQDAVKRYRAMKRGDG